jgi:hypothetical protein
MERGIIVVAYGDRARREATACLRSLGQSNPGLPMAVVSDRPLKGYTHLHAPDLDQGARLAKLSLGTLSPFEATCYLDADTRVHGSLEAGFQVLDDGWDLVITPSKNQGNDLLGNCLLPDREATFNALHTEHVLGLQAGVMWFRRCDATAQLFALWREEWLKFRSQDQGALLRALWRAPARVWLMGRTWNGGKGDMVEHRFGAARRAAA